MNFLTVRFFGLLDFVVLFSLDDGFRLNLDPGFHENSMRRIVVVLFRRHK